MSIALEVSFRGVPPSEALVAMAAEQYRLFKRDQPDVGECLVVLQANSDARRGRLTHALVRLGAPGSPRMREAEARHRDPGTALRHALSNLRESARPAYLHS